MTKTVLISLQDAEQCVCMHCRRSVIGICPLRGNEPTNPEKATCPTIRALRELERHVAERPEE